MAALKTKRSIKPKPPRDNPSVSPRFQLPIGLPWLSWWPVFDVILSKHGPWFAICCGIFYCGWSITVWMGPRAEKLIDKHADFVTHASEVMDANAKTNADTGEAVTAIRDSLDDAHRKYDSAKTAIDDIRERVSAESSKRAE